MSGMGVTSSARNRDNAVRLLEWLSVNGQGQGATPDTLSGGNYEFPVNPAAPVHPIVAGFGSFKIDSQPKSELGRFQPAAIRLMERAGHR